MKLIRTLAPLASLTLSACLVGGVAMAAVPGPANGPAGRTDAWSAVRAQLAPLPGALRRWRRAGGCCS